eukprot:98290-Prorocentrum_minimum.AAC.1
MPPDARQLSPASPRSCPSQAVTPRASHPRGPQGPAPENLDPILSLGFHPRGPQRPAPKNLDPILSLGSHPRGPQRPASGNLDPMIPGA